LSNSEINYIEGKRRKMNKLSSKKTLSTLLIFAFLLVGIVSADSWLEDYLDNTQMIDSLQRFEELHPSLCRAESLGYSTNDSMPIWGLKISNNPYENENKPAIFINGIIHAEEVVGGSVCIFLADTLLTSYGIEDDITRWVDEMEIWIVPVVNPEGYQVVLDSMDIYYRKNKRDNNGNGIFDYDPEPRGDCDGVDLNRNFPVNWDGADSEPNICESSYRGPSAGSESETQAMIRLCERERFVASVWYHSSQTGTFNEKIIYPYRWATTGESAPDYSTLSSIAMGYANSLVKHDLGNPYDFDYNRNMNGNSPDWHYVNYGAMAFIVEIDTTTQPTGELLDFAVHNQFNGLCYLLDRTLGCGFKVTAKDCDSDSALVATIHFKNESGDFWLKSADTDPLHGTLFRLTKQADYTVIAEALGFESETLTVTLDSDEIHDIEFCMSTTGVSEKIYSKPHESGVLNIAPNPFNSSCIIDFEIPDGYIDGISIDLYDLMGILLKNLYVSSTIPVLKQSLRWSPDDNINSGIYHIIISDLRTGTAIQNRKIIYLK